MYGAMSYYNRSEILDFVAGEAIARGHIDTVYRALGYEIVDRNGTKQYDVILQRGEKRLWIEEKFRTQDRNDFLVEILQCIVTREPGWFYTTGASHISYVVCTRQWVPVRFYAVDFVRFKPWLFEFLETRFFVDALISPRGKGLSLNLCIKWHDIDPDLYKRFDDLSKYISLEK